jgi:hypothetical protein
MHDTTAPADRRQFLVRTATAGAIAAISTLPAWMEAQAPAPATQGQIDARAGWLRGVDTKYRQFFETGTMNNFIPFLHVANYYAAWKGTAGVRPTDMTAVVGIFGMAIPAVLSDAMWSKYQLGKMLNLVDASTGAPYLRNPYLAPRNGELFGSDDVTLAGIQRLGARVILCNNAFSLWVMLIAKGSGQEMAAVRAELLPEIAPGVTMVPAMVQAVEQAQRAGLTYMKNS